MRILPRSPQRHSPTMLGLSAILATVALVVLAALPASAAPGGGGPKRTAASLALVVLDGPDAVANHYEHVTFAISQSSTDRPFVGIRCTQNGALMYDTYIGFFPEALGEQWATLDSLPWDGAMAADCTARLFAYDRRGNQVVMATTDFTAGI